MEQNIETNGVKKRMVKKRYILIAILILFAIIWFYTPIPSYFTEAQIKSLVNSAGMFGPFVFMAIYIIGLLLLIPATIFTVLGGILFGALFGTIYVVIAATLGGVIGFLIARRFGSVKDKKFNNKLVDRIVQKCNDHCEENGLQTFIVLRLLFLPYMPLSYAAGFVKTAKLSDFTIATFITNIIGSFTFVYFGSQLHNGPRALILPVVLIALTLMIPRIVKKFKKNGS